METGRLKGKAACTSLGMDQEGDESAELREQVRSAEEYVAVLKVQSSSEL